MNQHEVVVDSTPEPPTLGFDKSTANPNGKIFWQRARETPSGRYDLIVPIRPTEFIFMDTIPTASSKRFFGIGPLRVPELRKFETEREAFLKLKDSLLGHETYTGKFVAIHRGNIVCVGEDKRELARKVYAQFGYVPIYIGKVERVRRVIEMPSPEGP